MRSLREAVFDRYMGGKYLAKLKAHSRGWQQRELTRYLLDHIVRDAAEEDRAADLYEALLNDEFRSERQSRSGINELRADLQIGRDYFSRRRPDLLRYVQLIFLEQHANDDPATVQVHQEHCQGFTDFLQLGKLPAERASVGLHRALQRFFPIVSRPEAWYALAQEDRGVTAVQLADYELGEWRCSCGYHKGLLRRYEYSCPCGELAGSKRLEAMDSILCKKCKQAAAYVMCENCGTRVTLDVFWRLQEGNANPSIYYVPLTLDLLIQRSASVDEKMRIVLMYVPIMLGLKERKGSFVFELPDIFWVREDGGRFYERDADGGFVGLTELLRYDRQTNACKVFEAAFRRTLWGAEGTYRAFEEKFLRQVIYGKSAQALTGEFTVGFHRRLSRNLATTADRDNYAMRFSDFSQECLVASSSLLRDNMAFINRRLADPAALSAPRLVTLSTILAGDDMFTREPPKVEAAHTSNLDEVGIIVPGSTVAPGDVIVGVASPLGPKDITPEERLLRAIFGEPKVPPLKNTSLVMRGGRPGRVIAEHIRLPHNWTGLEIPAYPGRFIDPYGGGEPEGPRVTVTVAVDQPIETGDTLLVQGQGNTLAVICGILGGASLRRMSNTAVEPDVVVAPDHPWAPIVATNGHRVRVHVRKSTLTGVEATSRASGYYDIVSRQPSDPEWVGKAAQVVTPREFDWLDSQEARYLALELFGPRSDCRESLVRLHESLLGGQPKLADLNATVPSEAINLRDSPSEAILNWDRFLRGARIEPTVIAGCIAFSAMSDEDVITASFGEVRNILRYEFETKQPSPDGLFSERIFGAAKSWQCACGRSRGREQEGFRCISCKVPVAYREARRYRAGHITLAAPVFHCWYLRGANLERLAQRLAMSLSDLNAITNFSSGVVVTPGSATFHAGQIVDLSERSNVNDEYFESGLEVAVGAEALEFLLKGKHKDAMVNEVLAKVVFRQLPVVPPGVRPDVRFSLGQLAVSDLNRLYESIIFRNGQVRNYKKIRSLETYIDRRRYLQTAVDQLLDNMRSGRSGSSESGRLVSMGEALRLRAGSVEKVRDAFLHRSVDYSGQTRLVAADTPNLDTAMLPEQFAWELFKPILIGRLREAGIDDRVASVPHHVERRSPQVLKVLEDVCSQALILVAAHSGPWPLIAMQVQLSRDVALRIRPELLDLIGWVNLGEPVRVFAVLTSEARQEAMNHLKPNRLEQGKVSESAACREQTSFFDLPQKELLDVTSWATLSGEHFPISRRDHLLLCGTHWLAT